MPLSDCRIIELPKITDERGSLTFVESNRNTPFDFKRIYYLYDIPEHVSRGAHAHRSLKQLIIALAGSFDVVLDDGHDKKRFNLNCSYYGLYICPMIWRQLNNFSSGAVCMVLASDYYDEFDYIRDYEQFLKEVSCRLGYADSFS